ncbi:unnamed protein product [Darwinula stevensoni]|uniref:Uncharacterized protein n=1 Tax=Darwinula stevensoni TaxID=69355 RepID=A0A7R9A5Y0_9CRUS|nr:unnamed protein product [Darwinula stevensoni]CAG0892928.1 unnamed protein product [Darwinula stevensoni]
MPRPGVVSSRQGMSTVDPSGDWVEMGEGGGKRFQVNRVRSQRSDGAEESDQFGSDEFLTTANHNIGGTSTYDTRYLKSLRHLTREAFPREHHYRNMMSIQAGYERPTLDELHAATVVDEPRVTAPFFRTPDFVPTSVPGRRSVEPQERAQKMRRVRRVRTQRNVRVEWHSGFRFGRTGVVGESGSCQNRLRRCFFADAIATVVVDFASPTSLP